MQEVIKWLWYTDIVEHIDFGMWTIFWLSIFTFCITGILMLTNTDDEDWSIKLKPVLKYSIISLCGALIINLCIPSTRTMLSIVASKAGNEVITTDVGKKAMAVLNKKLDQMLKGK